MFFQHRTLWPACSALLIAEERSSMSPCLGAKKKRIKRCTGNESTLDAHCRDATGQSISKIRLCSQLPFTCLQLCFCLVSPHHFVRQLSKTKQLLQCSGRIQENSIQELEFLDLGNTWHSRPFSCSKMCMMNWHYVACLYFPSHHLAPRFGLLNGCPKIWYCVLECRYYLNPSASWLFRSHI